jgi:hypothetical protein
MITNERDGVPKKTKNHSRTRLNHKDTFKSGFFLITHNIFVAVKITFKKLNENQTNLRFLGY